MPENSRTTNAVEDLMYSTPFEGLSQYRAPYCRELEGRTFDVVFDDGYEMTLSFPSRDKILLTENGTVHMETCHCMKAEDTAYFIMVERRNATPRAGIMMVLDLNTNLVTGVFVEQGAVSDFPGLVTRVVRFGAISDGDNPLPTQRHHYTDELIGKKIEWIYNPQFRIIHVYLAPDSYCFAFNAEMRKQMEQTARENGREPVRSVQEPSIYVKLRDNLYLFSFIEKNGGSGTEGMMIINTDRVTDVGSFFGLNPEGKPEAYMFSAYGHWVTEHLEEEDMFKS